MDGDFNERKYVDKDTSPSVVPSPPLRFGSGPLVPPSLLRHPGDHWSGQGDVWVGSGVQTSLRLVSGRTLMKMVLGTCGLNTTPGWG